MKSKIWVFMCVVLMGNIVQAQSQRVVEFEGSDSCFDGERIYSVGATTQDQSGQILICKKYDAIVPESAYRLEKGYAYWERGPAAKRIALPIRQ
jgi:hypothetical protein